MSAAKHTPGPWTIDRRCNGLVSVIDFAGDTEFTAGRVARCEAEDDNSAAIHVNDANARLIAAAPNLAEALARVAEFLHANYAVSDMPDILPMVDAALAKVGV